MGSKDPGVHSQNAKFRSLSVTQETFQELEILRKREQKALGIRDLSWNDFLSRAAKKMDTNSCGPASAGK